MITDTYADLDAVRDGEVTLTYAELGKQVDRAARALVASGIAAGDAVAAVAESPTICTRRTGTASARGPTTTPALLVRVASRFDVWWSISSSRPWAAEKNSPTWRVVALSRRPGCVRWSTK